MDPAVKRYRSIAAAAAVNAGSAMLSAYVRSWTQTCTTHARWATLLEDEESARDNHVLA